MRDAREIMKDNSMESLLNRTTLKERINASDFRHRTFAATVRLMIAGIDGHVMNKNGLLDSDICRTYSLSLVV